MEQVDYPPPTMFYSSLEGDGSERMKIGNVFGTTFRGQIGKKIVASKWKGHEYIRAYTRPQDAASKDQVKQRARFKEAIRAWQDLSGRQQEFYERIAVGMSGCNLFVHRYIEAVKRKMQPEVPIQMSWTTEDGQPVEDGKLVIIQGGRQLFNDDLDDARGQVALTPSDAPYVFVLRNGEEEDIVLEIRDLLETDVPMTLESKRLGIKLVADVLRPPKEPTGGQS